MNEMAKRSGAEAKAFEEFTRSMQKITEEKGLTEDEPPVIVVNVGETTPNSRDKSKGVNVPRTYTQNSNRGAAPKAVVTTDSLKDSMLGLLMDGVQHRVAAEVDVAANKQFDKWTKELNPIIEEAKQNRRIEIVTPDASRVLAAGRMHTNFEKLLQMTTQRWPIMLVGAAGTGKTYAAEKVGEALGLEFYAMSVGSQTSKTDILGYMSANGDYVRTLFRDAYENGGVFLMDEIDAGNSNVLIVINAALSGNFCPFPDGMVKKHPDFYFLGAANTYGTGADRMYVGRNQIDAATLDRFIVLDWDVDEELEGHLVAHYENGKKWHNVVKAVRKVVNESQYRVVVSPRATIKGAMLLDIGHTFEEVVDSVLTAHAGPDPKSRMYSRAKEVWGSN